VVAAIPFGLIIYQRCTSARVLTSTSPLRSGLTGVDSMPTSLARLLLGETSRMGYLPVEKGDGALIEWCTRSRGHAVMKLQSPEARAETRLAICLALIAGYVDAYGLITLGAYVSFMSGNTTLTGLLTGQGKVVAALPTALAIVCFLAGVLAGTWLMNCGLRQARRCVFGVVAAFLAVVISASQLGFLNTEVSIATLSLAMGLMNTTLSHVGAEPINLTFVTGTLNKLGRHLVLAVMRAPLPNAQGPWDTHLHRACIMASVWAGFLTGAVLSGAADPHFGVWTLLLPFLVLLVLALFRGKNEQHDRNLAGAEVEQIGEDDRKLRR
jgi:uncharacterized membrane protein YoaK (UPF0700 family)